MGDNFSDKSDRTGQDGAGQDRTGRMKVVKQALEKQIQTRVHKVMGNRIQKSSDWKG